MMQEASLSFCVTLFCLWCHVHGQSQEGELRLNNYGSTGGSSGRLEIYHNSQWGTVCDDLFGYPDATVACRQLGYNSASSYGRVGSLGFSQASSSAPTWLDNVSCSGSESRLASCSHNGYGNEDCSHSEDVALRCSNSSLSDGDLRLNNYGSTGGSSGRLEIYYNSQWGTVCDDSFGSTEADVACRQLGYSSASSYGSVGTLGFSQASSSTRTWLDDVNCSGSESRLASCSHRGYGNENCAHSEDIALRCSNSSLSDGDLRLVNYGSTGGSSGRLEIYYNSQWGTVCDDFFGSTEADVACRQLGYSSASSYGSVGTLGFFQASSSTRTWLDDVNCFGSESRLALCNHRGYGNENCVHSEDIALRCSGSTTSLSDGDLRLNNYGSTRSSSGRLEIYHNSQWGTVCDDLFGSTEADVACRQLGYSNASSYGSVGTLGFLQASSSTRTWLDDVNCFGSESRLASCSHSGYGVEDCSHSEDIALRCSGSTTSPSDGDLRLNSYGSTGGSSGRLEIYYNSQWGTVCDDSFGSTEANVACKQLGYSSASRYGSVGALGFSPASSSTPTWLDDVYCFGSESRLASCSHRGYGNEDCSHSEDIALFCSNTPATTTTFSQSQEGELRLKRNSGSTGGSSGRLEIYHNSQWGTVCDDGFGSTEADVACRQLGYSSASCYGNVERFGFSQVSSSTPTWLDDVNCSGSESRLASCSHRGYGNEGCSHSEDIVLYCSWTSSTPATSSFLSTIGAIIGGTLGGVVLLVVIVVVCIVVCVCCLTARSKSSSHRTAVRTAHPPTTSNVAMVTYATTQGNTAYPTQQAMYSFGPQQPPPSAYPTGPQQPPPTACPTGPQQPPSSSAYPTGPQQPPPTACPTGPQQPPSSSAYPTGPQQPPSSAYFTLQDPTDKKPVNPELSAEAPPAYNTVSASPYPPTDPNTGYPPGYPMQ